MATRERVRTHGRAAATTAVHNPERKACRGINSLGSQGLPPSASRTAKAVGPRHLVHAPRAKTEPEPTTGFKRAATPTQEGQHLRKRGAVSLDNGVVPSALHRCRLKRPLAKREHLHTQTVKCSMRAWLSWVGNIRATPILLTLRSICMAKIVKRGAREVKMCIHMRGNTRIRN